MISAARTLVNGDGVHKLRQGWTVWQWLKFRTIDDALFFFRERCAQRKKVTCPCGGRFSASLPSKACECRPHPMWSAQCRRWKEHHVKQEREIKREKGDAYQADIVHTFACEMGERRGVQLADSSWSKEKQHLLLQRHSPAMGIITRLFNLFKLVPRWTF